jgi:hypothetical protein
MLNLNSDEWYRAIGSRLVCLVLGRWSRYAADEEGFGLDRLEQDVDVESGETAARVDICDCFCQGGLGGCGGEGAGGMVDNPERHLGGNGLRRLYWEVIVS